MTQDHPIPLSAIDAHVAVLGKTGTGKSYTARGLAEQLLQARRQVVILDPTGAWWGLRSHFEIPIFGGEHGDVPISDTSGEAVAAAIIEQQTSAIVDLKLLAKESGAAMRRFVSAFAKRLKTKPAGAFYLIIDEADEFLPQNLGQSGGDTQLFGHLKWMVRRGRIDGFRVMMVTQRPAEIAKAVLTQIETLICHRVTAPQDRRAIEDWIKGNSDSGVAREVLDSLASLEKGQAWVWAPEHDVLELTRIPQNVSHDSSATPHADAGVIEQPTLASIDMSAIVEALEPCEAERVDKPHIEAKSTEWGAALRARDTEIAALKDEIMRLRVDAEQRVEEAASDGIRVGIERARAAIENLEIPAKGGEGSQREQDQPGAKKRGSERQAAAPVNSAPTKPQRASSDGAGQVVTAGETARLTKTSGDYVRLLRSAAPDGMTFTDMAIMTGRAPHGGAFNRSRVELRDGGWIEDLGDGMVKASEKALAANDLGYGHWPSASEIVEKWSHKLGAGAGDVLRLVFDHQGVMLKSEIGRLLGKATHGGSWNRAMKALRTNGLAETSGDKVTLSAIFERPFPIIKNTN